MRTINRQTGGGGETRPAIALVAPTLEVLGGMAVQAQALATTLCDYGYPVMVIPFNPPFPAPAQWLRRYRYVRTAFSAMLFASQLRKLRRVDVVHVFSASYWSFLLVPAPAILAAKLLRKPVILHYHSGEAADHLARWRRSVPPFLRMVDEIVVPSVYLQGIFASHGYRARVIPNLIDTSRFRYRERMPLRPRLLSVRMMDPYYRVENTLAGFVRLKERFPDATLVIAGHGSQEKDLRQLVRRIDVSGVEFVGDVEPSALPETYDAADIFVNSSVLDNQPVSILEAFAAGMPVVSTPTGDIRSMLGNGEAGVLIDPENPSALADAVSLLLEDPVHSLRIVRRALELLERYSRPCVGAQWAALYTELLSRTAAEDHSRSAAPSFSSHV